jgi:hypothetical protein
MRRKQVKGDGFIITFMDNHLSIPISFPIPFPSGMGRRRDGEKDGKGRGWGGDEERKGKIASTLPIV